MGAVVYTVYMARSKPEKVVVVCTRVTVNVWAQLREYCATQKVTRSEALRDFVEVGLARAEGDEAQAKATRRARR